MAELKTKPHKADVDTFLSAILDDRKRADAYAVLELMRSVTKLEPVMWGASMVGFGSYHYKYASGREGDWFLTGFSPRKDNLTLYLMTGFEPYPDLLAKLGKFKTGKSCLYIKSLDDIHLPTLKNLIKKSVATVAKMKWD